MAGIIQKNKSKKDFMKNTSLESIDDENLDRIIKDIVEKNQEIIIKSNKFLLLLK